MTNELTLKIDRILWKWWLGKDDDNQEAFDDLIDTIIVNKDDFDIKPWSSTTMSELTFNITTEQLEILKEIAHDLTLDEYINGCLVHLRKEEEKIKATFKITE